MLGNTCCALRAIAGNIEASTDTASMKVGQTIELRFVGTSNTFVHPMPVHDVASVVPSVPASATLRPLFLSGEAFVNLERSRREIVRLWLCASAPHTPLSSPGLPARRSLGVDGTGRPSTPEGSGD